MRGAQWLVDLQKLREHFSLDLAWLQGVVVVEPEYDILPEEFDPQQMRGMLCIVIERSALDAASDPPWDEYPSDEMAELVPLLRRGSFERDIMRAFAPPHSIAAVAMFDVDHFKKVNDTYGHQVGDVVLVRVAEILRTIAGRRGRGYRWGGEELSLLLPDFTVEEAYPLVERIRLAIAAATWPEHNGLVVTISVGLAGGTSGTAPALVLKRADDALYRAKQGGRDRTERG